LFITRDIYKYLQYSTFVLCVQQHNLLFKYVTQNMAGAIRFLNFTLLQNWLFKQNVVRGRLDLWALKWKDI